MTQPDAMRTAMRTLAVDATTARVLIAFEAAGVQSLLLKGPTLQPLWGSEHRPYVDTDLLVAPSDLARAGEVLAGLGFALALDHSRHAAVSEPHAQEWAAGGASIDLHWRVAGIDAAPERQWAVLFARAAATSIGGAAARAPDRAALALLVALHAAHHGTTAARPLEDLRRAVARLPREVWVEAVALAEELDAGEALASGLRVIPEGEALAAELDLAAVSSTRRRLMATEQPAAALGLLTMLERRSIRAVRAVLLPQPEFMRAKWPMARRGRAGLALAYAARLGARARGLPAAVRALRAARRRSVR